MEQGVERWQEELIGSPVKGSPDLRTKQWCKFDNDYHEFADMLGWNPQNRAFSFHGRVASDHLSCQCIDGALLSL